MPRERGRGAFRAGTASPPRIAPPMQDCLSKWEDALDAWAESLRASAAEAGDTGARAIGSRWAEALRELAGRERHGAKQHASEDLDLASAMVACDRLEAYSKALGAAQSAILDPNVASACQRGMSRTYSENFGRLARAAETARAAASSLRATALVAAGEAGASMAAVSLKLREPPSNISLAGRGAVATELYVSALVQRALAGDKGAATSLGAARDSAFGSSGPDSVGAATAAFSSYHPVQAMCYAPYAFVKTVPKETGADATFDVDLSLPQARTAVTYDLATLVDKRRALEHGPLATAASGLSYKLVERLRTIRVTPCASPARDRPLDREGTHRGPLGVTLGGDLMGFGPESPDSEQAPAEWAPFAGPQPRVEGYCSANCAVILEVARKGAAAGWGKEIKKGYEAAMQNEELPLGPFQTEALEAALVTEFERAYDVALPETNRDLLKMALGADFEPVGCVCAAVSRLGTAMLDDALSRALVAGKTRVAYAALEREARLTQALQSLDAARDLWRHLARAYKPNSLEREAKPPHAPYKKAEASKEFRQAVRGVLSVLALVGTAPCLKLYAATGGS
jgi:hypothetical protein